MLLFFFIAVVVICGVGRHWWGLLKSREIKEFKELAECPCENDPCKLLPKLLEVLPKFPKHPNYPNHPNYPIQPRQMT